ncbi:MAG: hypothetical protein KDI62_21705 [Anaerolineae bacterium]|nr:hypothetical protein [Anaerolineae bacterium]
MKRQVISLIQICVGRYEIVLLLALVTVSAVICLMRFNSIPVGAFFDDVHYIVLAESLSAGTGYRLVNMPGAPVEDAFPPGWPLLLTPLVTLFPENYTVLKLLSLLFWLASIPLMYWLFKTRLQPIYTLAIVALAAVNPSLVGMTGTVMSEAAYIFFSLMTLVLFEWWQQQERNQSVGLLILIGLTVFYTVMVRTIGISLLGALLLYLMFKYRRFAISMVGLLLLVLGPIAWFNYQNGGVLIFSPLYYEHLIYVGANLAEYAQFWKYGSFISVEVASGALIPVLGTNFVSKMTTSGLNYGLGVALLACTIWGYFVSLRRFKVMDLYVTLYFGILYLWVVYTSGTSHQTRLVIPMIPFLYFYLVQATSWGMNRFGASFPNYKSVVVVGLTCLIMLISLAFNYYELTSTIDNRVVTPSVGNLWLRQNTPPEAIVLSFDGISDYLYSHRRTKYFGPGITDLEQHVADNNIDYILIQPRLLEWGKGEQYDNYVTSTLLPYLISHPTKFKLVYENSVHHVMIFQVIA